MKVISTIVKRSLEDWKQFCEQVQSSTAVTLNESKEVVAARKKRAKTDFRYFVKEYFAIYADAESADFHVEAANKILKNPKLKGVLEWPREHAKSVVADIFIPMWLIIHDQLTGMILIGKNDDDARNLLSDVQAQLQFNQKFISDWGPQYKFGDWQEGDFTTQSGIRFVALGRGKSPRGMRKGEKRPNYAVCDDIDDDELVENPKRVAKIVKKINGALFFALSIKGARLIIAGNRIHPQSVLAHIVGDIKPNVPKVKGVWHSKVFATDGGYYNGKPSWYQRYTIQELREKMDAAGPTASKVEFYHDHVVQGTIFKEEYFQWKPMRPLKMYPVIIGYFDPSFENSSTSDFKAIRVWAVDGTEFHLLKSFVRRCSLTEAIVWMYDYEASLPSGVAVIWKIERQWISLPFTDAIENAQKIKGYYLPISADDRDKPNKYTRMVRMEPRYTNREVYFNIKEKYNTDMIEGNDQLKGIEPGYNTPDDSPDADEGAWHFLFPHISGKSFKPTIGRDKRKGW